MLLQGMHLMSTLPAASPWSGTTWAHGAKAFYPPSAGPWRPMALAAMESHNNQINHKGAEELALA